MAPPAPHPGMILGVARFYHDPRGSMRAMLASGPGEARLVAYAMIAVSIQLAGRVVELAAGDTAAADLAARVTEQAVSTLFFLPLAYYALAALGTALARGFGGHGGWFEGRAAFFWAALVASPVMLLSTLASLAIGQAPGTVQLIIGQAGPVFFAWALSQSYAEAFGFRRGLAVLAVIVALVVAVLGFAWAVSHG